MRRMVQLVMGRLRFTVPRTSARCMLVSFRLHARVASPHPRLLGPACCKERGVVWVWVTRAGLGASESPGSVPASRDVTVCGDCGCLVLVLVSLGGDESHAPINTPITHMF